MQIRIIVPVLMHGNVQWTKDQIAFVPEELGKAYIASKDATAVPAAEQATIPRPTPNLVPRPKPTSRPKPETRRSR